MLSHVGPWSSYSLSSLLCFLALCLGYLSSSCPSYISSSKADIDDKLEKLRHQLLYVFTASMAVMPITAVYYLAPALNSQDLEHCPPHVMIWPSPTLKAGARTVASTTTLILFMRPSIPQQIVATNVSSIQMQCRCSIGPSKMIHRGLKSVR